MRVRCPHCHNPIEIVEDSSFTEIDCPSCGSSFSLVGGDTTVSHRNQIRRLGQFELVQEVGIGKFGTVWLARDTDLDRNVAIKIPRHGALSPDEADVFFRDARAAAQLKHPNIVAVHEVGRDDHTVYIVSEYVKGANLAEWLSSQRMSPRESAELIVKVAEAVHHAHESGVVHRDLKPSNIMMDVDGQPHVIDFGLARRASGEITMTVDGHILGTPAYMSPEQAAGKGHHADRRSDVYSLGVVLFQLLTGELPFRGERQMLLLQIERDEPPRLRKFDVRIPRDLETISLKCLQKDPARRYQSAQELAEELNRWLSGKPIVARPVGRLERGWRWCRRNPVVASLATCFALALAGGTVVSTVFAIRAERSAVEARAATEEVRQQKDVVQNQRESARQSLYASNMNLARQAWETSNIVRVRTLLDQMTPQGHEADLRGWEWFYQQRLCQADLRTWNLSKDTARLAFTADGRRLAVAVTNQGDAARRPSPTRRSLNLVVLDTTSGVEHGRLELMPAQEPARGFYRHAIAISSNARRVAVLMEKTVQVWDAESGTVVRELQLPEKFDWGFVAISPSSPGKYSRRLVAG